MQCCLSDHEETILRAPFIGPMPNLLIVLRKLVGLTCFRLNKIITVFLSNPPSESLPNRAVFAYFCPV